VWKLKCNIEPNPKAETKAPEPKSNGTTKNFKFLKAMRDMKESIGDSAYYSVLNRHGFSKSNEITDPDKQRDVYGEMKSL